MANIRVDVNYIIGDGAEVVFEAPCDCSEVTGLSVYYVDASGRETFKNFSFKDAHGNDLASLDNVFVEGVYVKVILSVTDSSAYVQNADTNSYLEGRFDEQMDTEPAEEFGFVEDPDNMPTTMELADEISNIKNGTQQVGDSAKLGGKGASEYALIDGFETIFISTESTEDADQKLNALHENESNRGFYVRSIGFGTTHPKLGGATGLIIGFRSNQKYGWQLFVSYDDAKQMLFRQIYNSVWTDWDSNAFASDLANYLPLSGGTIIGNTHYPLSLQANSEVGSCIMPFYNGDSILGSIGFLGVDDLVYTPSSGSGAKQILHTGNKPSGSYTGNGDASNFRMVATGGIGDGCIVRSSIGVAIVTGSCVSILSGNSAVTDNSATWQNGELGMFSSHPALNASGVAYTYHVY